jgi:hypothetical protein
VIYRYQAQYFSVNEEAHMGMGAMAEVGDGQQADEEDSRR